MRKGLISLLMFLLPVVSAQDSGIEFENALSVVTKYGIWGFVIFGAFIFFLVLGGAIAIWQWKRKKWYLSVSLKMPRDGGRTINSEIAKGYWDAREATLWVKRQGMFGQKFHVKLDDAREYLQGGEVIELLGSGVNWKPILPQSYLTVINDKTGQEASVMKYSMDFTQDKHWAISSERSLVNTFSLSDVFSKLKDYIGWGLVIAIVILAEVVRVAYVEG